MINREGIHGQSRKKRKRIKKQKNNENKQSLDERIHEESCMMKNENTKKKKRDENGDAHELRDIIELKLEDDNGGNKDEENTLEIKKDEKLKKKKNKLSSDIGIMSDHSFFSLPLSEPTKHAIKDIGFFNMTQVCYFFNSSNEFFLLFIYHAELL